MEPSEQQNNIIYLGINWDFYTISPFVMSTVLRNSPFNFPSLYFLPFFWSYKLYFLLLLFNNDIFCVFIWKTQNSQFKEFGLENKIFLSSVSKKKKINWKIKNIPASKKSRERKQCSNGGAKAGQTYWLHNLWYRPIASLSNNRKQNNIIMIICSISDVTFTYVVREKAI